MQKAFVFDINKCTGCQACQVACVIENELDLESSWRQVDTFNAGHAQGLPTFHLSLACNHCVDPPCMEHCPALAYTKDPDTGAVTINATSCIGCKYCAWACPFDAPKYDTGRGVMEKCTFCHHRLQEGQRPACVTACPTGALQFADLAGAPGVASQAGFPETSVEPAIRFIPLEPGRQLPNASPLPDSADAGNGADAARMMPPRKITLRSEWPLAVFTLLGAILVGWFAGRRYLMAGGGFVFPVLAAIGAGLSTLHLGKPLRAYRAAFNWRHSWLSREVILFSLFAGAAVLFLLTRSNTVWITGTVTGFVMLFAMDRVYEVTRTKGLRLHSAQVLLSGFYFYGLFAGAPVVFGVTTAAKVALYGWRKSGDRRDNWRYFTSGFRTIVGLLLPAVLWAARGPEVAVIGAALIGEAIDRCEYYLDLDVPTPRRQMALDLRDALARSPVAAAAGE